VGSSAAWWCRVSRPQVRRGLGVSHACQVGEHDELDTVASCELVQDPWHVGLGGVGAELQCFGDFGVSQTAGDEPEDLVLA
jgi:hypothetical protein